MAVFQGARLRTTGLPVATAERSVRGVLPTTRPARLRPTTALMGVILAGTMLGLVYLTQTLGSNAATVQIAELQSQGKELARHLANQTVAVGFAADPVEVGRRARELGLVRLGDAVTLSAP
jgi:hypothetical protein